MRTEFTENELAQRAQVASVERAKLNENLMARPQVTQASNPP
jgi:hypothetical protein